MLTTDDPTAASSVQSSISATGEAAASVIDRWGSGSVPVLCLTILDLTGPPKILTGVRAADTNVTHPNVLSTPTARIPWANAVGLVEGVSAAESEVEHLVWLAGLAASNGLRRGRALGE